MQLVFNVGLGNFVPRTSIGGVLNSIVTARPQFFADVRYNERGND